MIAIADWARAFDRMTDKEIAVTVITLIDSGSKELAVIR